MYRKAQNRIELNRTKQNRREQNRTVQYNQIQCNAVQFVLYRAIQKTAVRLCFSLADGMHGAADQCKYTATT